MKYFFWTLGVFFALAAIPAAFYFLLYLARGDDILRERAGKFGAWAKLIGLLTFNVGIWGHVVVALLQIWGFLR
jgi:hypothetical protein